jgi:hypothetical protein
MQLNANNVFSRFYTGTIKKDEFEELVKSVIKSKMPDVKIEEIIYGKKGITIRAGQELIEISIDFDELIIEE